MIEYIFTHAKIYKGIGFRREHGNNSRQVKEEAFRRPLREPHHEEDPHEGSPRGNDESRRRSSQEADPNKGRELKGKTARDTDCKPARS